MPKFMELHQKLTILAILLLITTFFINTYHQEDHPDDGFNFAYVTGIAMLALFAASFIIFNKDKLKNSKN